MDTAYVITWRYSDGSGSGATAVFTDKARAERLVEILDKTDSMQHFKIEAVPFDVAPKEAPSEASRGPKNWLTEAREANEHILASRAEVADVRQLQAVARAAWEFVNCATNLDDDSLNPLRKALAAALPPAAPGTPGDGR